MASAKEHLERFKRLESERTNWDDQWQDCADYAMPNNSQIISERSDGEVLPDLFDTTAEESNIQLASGLYSFLFPTETKAFTLEVDDEELSNNDDVKQWLNHTTKIVHKYLIASTFREAFFEYLKSLGCFGTACLYEEKGKKVALVFINYFMRDIYIIRNSDEIVDTVYRRFRFSARQAVQEFGLENLGEKIRTAYDSVSDRDKKFEFLHIVEPREERDTNADDPKNMPFSSQYISKDEQEFVKESEGGYEEFPYQVSVFDKDSLEDYGRSSTMKKLPDIRMANELKRIRIKGWDKMVDPTVLVKDDGSVWPLTTKPGGVVFYRDEKPEYWEFKGSLSEMTNAIEETQKDIQRGYFVDMFDPLIDRQNMTATEIMARVEQKLRFLTPIIGRLQSGLFNPMIQRVIGILARQGKLPPMPEELSEQEFNAVYLGRLALALRTIETEGLTKTMAEWAPLADQGILDWLDNINVPVAFRDSARNNGVPATWIRSEDEVKQIQADRNEAAAAEKQLLAAQELAKTAKAGSTAPEPGSPTAIAMENGIG
jgi:phage pi2 protein 07